MKRYFGRIKFLLSAFLLALLLCLSVDTASANAHSSQPENRIGVMSEDVVRARLQQLGYKQPLEIRLQNKLPEEMQHDAPSREMSQLDKQLVPVPEYEVSTIKDGKTVLLRVNRLSGKIEEIQLEQ